MDQADRLKKNKTNPKTYNTDTLLKLYQIYDNHRNAILWFLEGLDAIDYNEYLEKYSGASSERSCFIAVCGFFELSGVLVSHGLIYENLYSLTYSINSSSLVALIYKDGQEYVHNGFLSICGCIGK